MWEFAVWDSLGSGGLFGVFWEAGGGAHAWHLRELRLGKASHGRYPGPRGDLRVACARLKRDLRTMSLRAKGVHKLCVA